jgi:S1-C subfamily serine protease
MIALFAHLVCAVVAQANPPAAPADLVTALETAIADSIAVAESSVVAITRLKNQGEETTAVRGVEAGRFPDPGRIAPDLLGMGDYMPLPGEFGSGVVIGDEGQILTAYHVIRGASMIRVRAAGRQEFDAEVIGADPRSDLAVLVPKLAPRASVPKLRPVRIGDATKLRKGSFLIALGNPYNTARDGKASASWGILANTTRRIEPAPDRATERQMFRYQPTLMQLDAKLNLGMSGGAVVNLKGELVGLMTTGGNPEGFDAQAGYAIPMDALGRRVVETLRAGKEVEYGFLGISLTPGAPNQVDRVEWNTPAAQGGLLKDDIITEVNGNPVNEQDGLSLALSTVDVGQFVRLTVRRGDRTLEKSVFVSKYPVSGQIIATNRPPAWRGMRVDFTSVVGDVDGPRPLEAMAKGGVGVAEVETGSPAETAGLKHGQIITEVAGTRVRTPSEFAQAVNGKKGPVTLKTESGEITVK